MMCMNAFRPVLAAEFRTDAWVRGAQFLAVTVLAGAAALNVAAIAKVYFASGADPFAIEAARSAAFPRAETMVVMGMLAPIFAAAFRRIGALHAASIVVIGALIASALHPLTWAWDGDLHGNRFRALIFLWCFELIGCAVLLGGRRRTPDRIFLSLISASMLCTCLLFCGAATSGIASPETSAREANVLSSLGESEPALILKCKSWRALCFRTSESSSLSPREFLTGGEGDLQRPDLASRFADLAAHPRDEAWAIAYVAGNQPDSAIGAARRIPGGVLFALLPPNPINARAQEWFAYLLLAAHTIWFFGGLSLLAWHRFRALRSGQLQRLDVVPASRLRAAIEIVSWVVIGFAGVDIFWWVLSVAMDALPKGADVHEPLLIRMNVMFDMAIFLLVAVFLQRRVSPVIVLVCAGASMAACLTGVFENVLHPFVLRSGLHPVALLFGLSPEQVSNQYVKLLCLSGLTIVSAILLWRRPSFRSLDRVFLTLTAAVFIVTIWLFHHFVTTGILKPGFDRLVEDTRLELSANGEAGVQALCRHPDSRCFEFMPGAWDSTAQTPAGGDAELPAPIKVWFAQIDNFAMTNVSLLHVAYLLRTPITDPRSNHILAYRKSGDKVEAIVLTGDATEVRRRGETWLTTLVLAADGVWLFGGLALIGWHRRRIARRMSMRRNGGGIVASSSCPS